MVRVKRGEGEGGHGHGEEQGSLWWLLRLDRILEVPHTLQPSPPCYHLADSAVSFKVCRGVVAWIFPQELGSAASWRSSGVCLLTSVLLRTLDALLFAGPQHLSRCSGCQAKGRQASGTLCQICRSRVRVFSNIPKTCKARRRRGLHVAAQNGRPARCRDR